MAYEAYQTLRIDQMHPSGTATSLGLSNKPASLQAEANLHVLRIALMLLPVGYHLNSAYRSPKVNKAVGGAGGKCTRIQGDTGYSNRCSYHTSGLAADITPIGMTNKQLAVWMYENRKRFPHLDQVIWYTDTSHIHIGLDPARARAYKNLPGGWYYAKKEGSEYTAWKPGDITLAGLTGVGNTGLVVGALVAAAVAAGIYRYR